MDFISELLIYFSFGFAVLRLLVASYNLLSNPVLDKRGANNSSITTQNSSLLLSILVPARNEEHTIRFLLESLQKQPFQNFELIILNDNSSDQTSNIVTEFARSDTRIKLIEGKPLPAGWLGKNWACHQLSQASSGQLMLFLDADVLLVEDAIYKALSVISTHNLSLLSIFPEQKIISVGEKLTVPIMHYLLLSLLPLDFIYYFNAPSLSAANGQFMLFNSIDYRKYYFHEMCKSEIVEDIRIMQEIKSNGLKGRTLLGSGLVYCRMYNSYSEGIKGFSKNLLSGFGNSKLGLAAFLLLVIVIPISMFFKAINLSLIYLFFALSIRVCISITSRQSVMDNLIFHFGQMAALTLISFKSIKNSYTKTLEWKGRKLG
ncbi:MAG: glycosyltransferase family 2 protein [Opitutaceae bacterium]|nr:glycosyltransferase family 2 protein [Cytophagales bacterium]